MTTGAVVAAVIAQAIKASGTIVNMKPEEFSLLLDRMDEPMVVMALGGIINTNYQYLTSYKGLAFFTNSSEKLPLPANTELITAKSIWIPG